jgi:hypothetical protein
VPEFKKNIVVSPRILEPTLRGVLRLVKLLPGNFRPKRLAGIDSVGSHGVKAYLYLQGGVTRREISNTLPLRTVRRDAGTDADGINVENIVWIFGSGRSGSTWLSTMMGDVEGHAMWGEPWVGTLFGRFYYHSGVERSKHQSEQFILGSHRDTWLGSIRNFVLDAAAATFPGLNEDNYLIIKEPNGSIGAPLIMEALPESRMILLVRDPRDVVASSMDARSEGGWNYERNKAVYLKKDRAPANRDRDGFAKKRAKNYLEGMGKAKEAYDAHQGAKVLVRYEELRSDTLGTMKRMYSTLGIEVDEGELARVVEKHSWENIPEEEKGEGKFYRKATPGGWREDLTPEQAEAIESITAPLLKELYPEFYPG